MLWLLWLLSLRLLLTLLSLRLLLTLLSLHLLLLLRRQQRRFIGVHEA